ncbi:MAG: hypothetical protein AAGI44_02810 [Pseudomonadota bacterium]
MLDKAAIDELIPHTGSMCVLDTVQRWDQDSIVCTSNRHHSEDNPLRESAELCCEVLLEYTAQAAAVHAALVGAGIGSDRTALMGAVKRLHLHQRVVEPSIETLLVSANAQLQSRDGAIYQVAVHGHDTPLITARIVLLIPKVRV